MRDMPPDGNQPNDAATCVAMSQSQVGGVADVGGLADVGGPGRYFDQTLFDLHFVLLAARARRMAADMDQPFSVDPSGRVTLTAKG
jgi:hypothetical protein